MNDINTYIVFSKCLDKFPRNAFISYELNVEDPNIDS